MTEKGGPPVNEFTKANAMLLESVAKQMADGQISLDEFNKLLNTVARFEERVEASSNHPTDNK